MRANQEKNRVYLSNHLLAVVLKEICKYTNVITLCNSKPLYLDLKKKGMSHYQGNCPWCKEVGSFLLDKKTGGCACTSCWKEGDVLDLACLSYELPFARTFDLLTESVEYLKKSQEQMKWRWPV